MSKRVEKTSAKGKRNVVLSTILVMMLVFSSYGLAKTDDDPSTTMNRARLLESFLTVPLHFEQNKGQAPGAVRFLSRGPGYALFLTPEGARLALETRGPQGEPSWKGLDLRFPGAEKEPVLAGLDPMQARIAYFKGNDPGKWLSDIPAFARVRYENLYPGIDLVLYGNQRQLEYDLVIKPGADADAIRLEFRGADGMKVNDAGELVLEVGERQVIQKAPVIYQERDGRREAVGGRYVPEGRHRVRFQLASYDKEKTLVIDPVLTYSTYLGGTGFDQANALVVDGSGNVYVTGQTASPDFDTVNPYQVNNAGPDDVFVSKIDPDQSGIPSLLYSTFLGGAGDDEGLDIAVDGGGNAYVTGRTNSPVFPVQPFPGAYQTVLNGAYDAFVTKLDPSGSALAYSTYLGGTLGDEGRGIDVDAAGNAYVGGATFSNNAGLFPAGSIQLNNNGGQDGFVTVVNTAGTGLVYSTYLGGSNADEVNGLALDASNNAYVTGQTDSDPAAIVPFPVTAGTFQPAFGGVVDAFLVKINSTGTPPFVYSSYFGGSMTDIGRDIHVDAAGNAYVTGSTLSNDFIVTPGAYQNANNGGQDAFVLQVNSNGNSRLYSSYLGGGNNDTGFGVAVGPSGNIYASGVTQSGNFPVEDPIPGNENLKGAFDCFVARFDPAQNGSASLVYSTYLGGSTEDACTDAGTDAEENVYVAGLTQDLGNFPTVRAYQSAHGGVRDAFVSRIRQLDPLTAAPDNITLTVGDSDNVTVNGGLAPYTASSDNPAAATADPPAGDNVTINGVAPGTATVTITDSASNTVAVAVTVTAGIPPLSLSPSSVTVAAGETADVSISGGQDPYTAASDNSSIADGTVSDSVLAVTGVAEGTTSITVTDSGGDNATVAVQVTEAPIPEFGGCAAGPTFADVVDTAADSLIHVLACRQPPLTLSGKLFVGFEAPLLFPGTLFFRPADSMVPLDNGSYITLAKTAEGFLPGAEDFYFDEGSLSNTAGDIVFVASTAGLAGNIVIVRSFYLPAGDPLTDVDLVPIQTITLTFN